jgi:hypothetical protein
MQIAAFSLAEVTYAVGGDIPAGVLTSQVVPLAL